MVYESKGYMELILSNCTQYIKLTRSFNNGGFNFLCDDVRGSITTAQAGKIAI